MKVLHLITGLNNGGAEAILYRLVINDKQNEHYVISLMDLGFYGKDILFAGVNVYCLNMSRGKLSLKGLKKLHQLINIIEPNVIQTWMYHADLIGSVMAKICGIRKVIWGVHHSDLSYKSNRFSTLIAAFICAIISHWIPKYVICCSQTAACVHIKFGYRSSKMVVISNGVDTSLFRPNEILRKIIRDEIKVNDDEILIGMVARWDVLKGHENFISALSELSNTKNLSWKCVLVGPEMNEENISLVGLLHDNKILKDVKLLGPRNDIHAIMNAIDLHVLSSTGEAFGNVTIEAMACGVPAIVTAVGAGELIVGKTGWVVQPSDIKALTNALSTAIEEMANSTKWDIRKIACRNRIVTSFSLDRLVKEYCNVWQS